MQRMHKILSIFTYIAMTVIALGGCSGKTADGAPQSGGPSQADATVDVPSVNADSIMANARRQVDFGPRVPGTSAHRVCADWLAAELGRYGAVVSDTTVIVSHPVTGQPTTVRNIMGRFDPENADRVMILAHYDTRPWADEDADAANHTRPIDGANDGASGVAVALEIARLVGKQAAGVGVDILFVDQEDSGRSATEDMEYAEAARAELSWCIGSRAWAQNLVRTGGVFPRYAILLDMVGDADAVFPRELFSHQYAGNVVDKIWKAADEAGYASRFVNQPGGAINDDHVSLLNVGIPTVDIIDIGNPAEGGRFPHSWHTLNDNIENLDAETMRIVGDVVTRVIYNEKP